jgi:hypothetical protein
LGLVQQTSWWLDMASCCLPAFAFPSAVLHNPSNPNQESSQAESFESVSGSAARWTRDMVWIVKAGRIWRLWCAPKHFSVPCKTWNSSRLVRKKKT